MAEKEKEHEYQMKEIFFEAKGRITTELEDWEIRDAITEAIHQLGAEIVDTSVEVGD